VAAQRSEFTVSNAYTYNRSNSIHWIFSHILRYKLFCFAICCFYLTMWLSNTYVRILIAQAAGIILAPTESSGLLAIALTILGILVLASLSALGGNVLMEIIAQRLVRDSREELYISLLGKSQTFHDRQRVGDLMARATDDLNQMYFMVSPGMIFIQETVMGLTIPVVWLATIRLELLLVPILFILTHIAVVRSYGRRLNPVVNNQRRAFGIMNAGLEETISGIEVVKASAQEEFERSKFKKNATNFRDYFAQQGKVEAGYLPTLFYAFMLGFGFLHSLLLYQQNTITIPDLIAVMGLLAMLRFPIFVSLISFSLLQLGIASAARVLHIINTESEMDENVSGYAQPMHGDIVFENVSFGYEDGSVLENISFHVKQGETIAIVGQTGSGKSTLTELINRTYSVTSGRILIDGVNVEDWNLTALRGQISKIEQDVFLFTRSLAENIAFGAPDTPQEQIEQAAKEAQAHNFIMSFPEGYQTEVGERGVTLSGGQRQRIALARAFLSNPRVLILDDSTSAIDSATEDEIQKAIMRAQQGRTTLLITHRLSQIRWADHILLLEGGKLIASGKHEDLLRTSDPYRRIFARYDAALPPVTAAEQVSHND